VASNGDARAAEAITRVERKLDMPMPETGLLVIAIVGGTITFLHMLRGQWGWVPDALIKTIMVMGIYVLVYYGGQRILEYLR
jgi:hypothetical protein